MSSWSCRRRSATTRERRHRPLPHRSGPAARATRTRGPCDHALGRLTPRVDFENGVWVHRIRPVDAGGALPGTSAHDRHVRDRGPGTRSSESAQWRPIDVVYGPAWDMEVLPDHSHDRHPDGRAARHAGRGHQQPRRRHRLRPRPVRVTAAGARARDRSRRPTCSTPTASPSSTPSPSVTRSRSTRAGWPSPRSARSIGHHRHPTTVADDADPADGRRAVRRPARTTQGHRHPARGRSSAGARADAAPRGHRRTREPRRSRRPRAVASPHRAASSGSARSSSSGKVSRRRARATSTGEPTSSSCPLATSRSGSRSSRRCATVVPVVSHVGGRDPGADHDGVEGLLVAAGDVDALASALRTLADDPARRAALGAAGHRRYEEQFVIGAAAERLSTLLGAVRLVRPSGGPLDPGEEISIDRCAGEAADIVIAPIGPARVRAGLDTIDLDGASPIVRWRPRAQRPGPVRIGVMRGRAEIRAVHLTSGMS